MSGNTSQKKVRNRFRDIPAWARDNAVLNFLDEQGFRIRVVFDDKYLGGLSRGPIIVIKRKPERKV